MSETWGFRSLLRAHLGFQELGKRGDNSQQGRNRGAMFYLTFGMISPIFLPTVILPKASGPWTPQQPSHCRCYFS